MKKFRFIVISFLAMMLSSTLYATSYDDAQWRVYDNTPAGASVTNVNGTVTFQGNGIPNGYKFSIDNNVNEFNFSWEMNFPESYIVYILVNTDHGYRFLYYTNADDDRGIHQTYTNYIHYGLGDKTSITRDLQEDLEKFESSNKIKSVKGFYVRGNGQMSNIKSAVDFEDPTDPEDPAENYDVVVYEDGEDGNTNGWSIYSGNKNSATISNVADGDNRVIQFDGNGRRNGYRLGNNHGRTGAWESPHTNITWRMKYDEPYTVYVRVLTKNESNGTKKYKFRYMQYSGISRDLGIRGKNNNYIHYGLGTDSKDGKWHTIERDLQADLQNYEPDNSIVSVNAFLIRGSGQVDDITLFSTNVEEEDEFPTLLADYRFDDCLWNLPNTVINSSGSELKGTAFDGASLTEDGLINNGGHFNGNGYISMGNVLNPGAIDKTSISVWFKWDGTDDSNVIFSKELVYMAEVKDGYFRYAVNPDWNFNTDQSFPVEANVWTHAVITYDGKTQKLYKNGELVHSRSISGDIGSNEHPFTIGAFKRLDGDPTYFFHGDIDELKVFGGALSSNRVQEIYTNELAKRNYDDSETIRDVLVCTSSINVSISDTTCIEGEDCIFDVNLSENAASRITIDYVTSNSDSADSDDYAFTSGTLVIPQNSSSGTITVPSTDDSDVESNETFIITISNAKLDNRIDLTINDSEASGLIINNDVEIVDPVEPVEQTEPWLEYEAYTVYEDGEDASDWKVYSGNGGNITTVMDGNRSVIKLSGNSRGTGYRLNGRNWDNTSEFNIHWSMKFSENYTVYVAVQTINGFRYIQYNAGATVASSNIRYVRVGLGDNTANGTWISFKRNLQDDLHMSEPDNNITAVKSFLVRGSGMIDDVFLFSEDTIEPEPENNAPIAYDQNITVDENASVDIELRATDEDQDSTLSFEVSTPTNGTLTGTAPNLTYTPNADYDGVDSFTYTVTDDKNATATATINITINNITAETDLPAPKAHFEYTELGANGLDFTKNSIAADGNDVASLDYNAINGLEDFTISTWIKSSDLNGRSIISGVNDSANNNQVNNELHLIINYDSYIYMVIKDRESPVRLPYTLEDNEWHMLTWTREGDTSCMFIDGDNKAGCVSGYPTGPLVIADGGFILGQEQDTVGGGFDLNQNFLGYQDEIRIYDEVLTTEQIKAIYEIDKSR